MSQSGMSSSLVEARSRFTASSIRWGFMCALWARCC